ncbi:MAG: phosphoenolpyruvate synthase [Thermaerobacter sp.]|nr:phosphoenolpyruvate synthase [Thermaerobacter sp.]
MNSTQTQDLTHPSAEEWMVDFATVRKTDVARVGGKCASLGELMSIGVAVPPGFAITAPAFEYFLRYTGIQQEVQRILQGLNAHDSVALDNASHAIRQLIEAQTLPPEFSAALKNEQEKLEAKMGRKTKVAVRSSATLEDLPDASFAGQLDTFLFVEGIPALEASVKKCFGSLFTARVLAYRLEKGLEHIDASVSVGVQAMVDSESSGVMFTLNPTTGDADVCLVEACWGVGESLAQGHVTPDQYMVAKGGTSASRTILERVIAQKERMTVNGESGSQEVEVPRALQEAPCLQDAQVKELVAMGQEIERHYGRAMDIEWAVDADSQRLYILQARPETVWSNKKPLASAKPIPIAKATILKRGKGASPGVVTGKVHIVKDLSEIYLFKAGEILVTDMTTTEWLPAERIAGALITNTGGVACHAAIISRELGIPCIVATKDATSVLKSGSVVTVDGERGIIYDGVVQTSKKPESAEVDTGAVRPMAVADVPVTATKVYMILANTDKIDQQKLLPFDGVGLMRIEFIIADHIGEHPMAMLRDGRGQEFVDRLAEGIAMMAEAVYPRPVLLRFSDLKTNEYRILRGGTDFEPEENNPMIGWRGASRYISPEYEPAFRLECQAVRKVREEMGLKNVWSMLPFVRQAWEVEKIYSVMAQEGLHRGRDYKVWIMAEVPSNFVLADQFAQLCDGFTIGVNDLVQLMLGVDRDSAILAEMGLFDEMDEAVLAAMKHLIVTAHKYGREVCVCGQAPSMYPRFTQIMVEQNVDMVGVNPDAVVKTRRIIADAEQRVLMQRMKALEGKVFGMDPTPGWAG